MTSFNIYDHATQKQIDNFKPTFLYIKRHTVTGKLYFGKTIRTGKAFESYNGSGIHWRNHIKKHGVEHVDTIWYCYYEEIETLVDAAVTMSKTFNVLDSNEWLNAVMESGLGGGTSRGKKQDPEVVARRAAANTGKKRSEEARANLGRFERTVETREKIRVAHTGRKRSKQAKNNMSIAQTGKKRTAESIQKQVENTRAGKGYGHLHTEETKALISERTKDGMRRAKELKNASEERIRDVQQDQSVEKNEL